MRSEYDVVIIGAGPIGGYLARRLNEFGHSVLLIEEHDEIGRPFQCAGLINPLAMKRSHWKKQYKQPSGERTYTVKWYRGEGRGSMWKDLLRL